MSDPGDEERWRCPWCGEIARDAPGFDTLCESRSCPCGALALAHPVVDFDELVDEAIGIFRVAIRRSSLGFDGLLLGDISRAGVEVKLGERIRLHEGGWGNFQHVWFRRTGGDGDAFHEAADVKRENGGTAQIGRCPSPILRCGGPVCGGPLNLVVSRSSPPAVRSEGPASPRSQAVAGAILLMAGAAIAADGLVAGPHAFGFGWYSVSVFAVVGLLLMMAGAAILRETRRIV